MERPILLDYISFDKQSPKDIKDEYIKYSDDNNKYINFLENRNGGLLEIISLLHPGFKIHKDKIIFFSDTQATVTKEKRQQIIKVMNETIRDKALGIMEDDEREEQKHREEIRNEELKQTIMDPQELKKLSETVAIEIYTISQLQNGDEEWAVNAQKQHESEVEIAREAFMEGVAWVVNLQKGEKH